MDISEWRRQLEMEREEKDRFFKMSPQSPISYEDRERFTGLDYYPVNLAYRFELKLYEHKEKKTIKMAFTKGNEQNFIRWGEFRFRTGEQEQILQVYKKDPSEDMLFISFKDATSGKETYGAGRYIDLESERDQTADGKWILDFNKAYNPWCVFSEDYTCPLVPPENWLKIPIYAGEKNYPLKK
ncbi:MAG: hypothetical protein COS84_00805 [Armatimonadetes bacterium CG07_land_8_20_14_0_80_40_9]|nr:MAG: hypothetical protein COS84_00805 [Armatimonadetes bacterium CG07_land_8_20_14_0_80_40_9]